MRDQATKFDKGDRVRWTGKHPEAALTTTVVRRSMLRALGLVIRLDGTSTRWSVDERFRAAWT